jgi:hypothetical protein
MPSVIDIDPSSTVANGPNSMPSVIDIDPSSTLGSDIIMERLWALVTTPRTEARRMMTFMIGE